MIGHPVRMDPLSRKPNRVKGSEPLYGRTMGAIEGESPAGMQRTVQLSVVIPARNAGALLKIQLEALARQDWACPWEVIVVDNGSEDNTRDVAKSFADSLPIRIVDAKGRPCRAVACNRGVAACTGTYLLFVDADDQVGPGYVRAMSAALDNHDFVAARLDCSALNHGWVAEVRTPAQCHGLGEGLFPYAYGGSFGVWRSSFEGVGGYDELFDTAEDIDFCYRMALAGSTLTFVPDAVLNYRFRTTLLGIWRQAYSYGLGAGYIRHRYHHFDDASTIGLAGLRWWGGVFRLLMTARSKGALARGLYLTANRLGRLRGRVVPGKVR